MPSIGNNRWKRDWRRTQAINDTKIQYLLVADTKIYKVSVIDFYELAIEANETDLSIADVPENEVFPVEEFGEFRVRLCNGWLMSRCVQMDAGCIIANEIPLSIAVIVIPLYLFRTLKT